MINARNNVEDCNILFRIFERKCSKYPNEIAIDDFSKTITNSELYKLVVDFAYNIESTVKDIPIVPILAKRTIGYVVTILALSKLGITYTALDPSYPHERITSILSQIDANCLFTCGFQKFELAEYNDLHIVRIENDCTITYAGLGQPFNCRAFRTFNDVTVVMFTSGTTGNPKGVQVTASGLINLVSNVEANCKDIRRILHHSNISFDAGLFELWVGLLTCTTIVLHKENFNIDGICESIVKSQCNLLLLATSLFHVIIENNCRVFSNLKYLFTGGEVLNPSHANMLLKNIGDIELFNGYGPTENTVYSTWYRINEPILNDTDIPIGLPLSGVTIKVVDEYLNPLGTNTMGELLVGGHNLSLGYLDPVQTRNKYVYIGQELYFRTGDIVVQNEEGVLFFRGRSDDQVKINGYRVEISEVERYLTQLESIHQSAVICQSINSIEQRLTAFVTILDHTHFVNEDKVKHELSLLLPNYMVPSKIFILDCLPLTPNGKIDKRRLIQDNLSKIDSIRSKRKKESINDIVIDTWRRYLNSDSVTLNSDLRNIGASSITMTIVHSKLDKIVGVNTPSVDILSLNTVNDWCKYYQDIKG